jgi:hypothetical protein
MSTDGATQNQLWFPLMAQAELCRHIGSPSETFELFGEEIGYHQCGRQWKRSVEGRTKKPMSVGLSVAGLRLLGGHEIVRPRRNAGERGRNP